MSERRVFVVVVAIVLIICAGLVFVDRRNQMQQRVLYMRTFVDNVALWSKANISNYEFSIRYSGAWPEAPPMHVVVRNGAVESGSLLCLPPHTQENCREWAEAWKDIYGPDKLPDYAKTVPQLFDRMSAFRSELYERNARVLAEFDPTYGYPIRFGFDNTNTADDEYNFEISEFRVIQ